MKPREWIAVALTMALAVAAPNFARAQTQQLAPAPAFHEPTKLTFPPRIADANQTRSVDYANSFDRPDLGYSWNYGILGTLVATIYLYNMGQPSIPSGASSPLVLGQFNEAMSDMVRSKKYDTLVPVVGPKDCVVGAVTFRCVTETATTVQAQPQKIKTELLVTGFRNYFLKIRLDWLQGSPQGDAAAEHFVQALVSQVLH